jgi:putative lipoic acid-binding regulatory protein
MPLKAAQLTMSGPEALVSLEAAIDAIRLVREDQYIDPVPQSEIRPSMDQMPAISLLESTHQFPCPYMFKVIGKADNGFVARVVAAVREELAVDADPPYQLRQAAGGRHVAITLEPQVSTARQVLAVYQRIRKTDGLVLMF